MSEYSLPFDQFQRYSLIADLIGRIRGDNSLRLLDIGGNEHANLSTFLPASDNYILDSAYLPEQISPDISVIYGDGLRLPFRDAAFDFAVSLDVLEHIEAARRHDFLVESFRVSRSGAIAAFPEGPVAARADEVANSLWQDLFGENYRWLAEHIEHGLPSDAEVLEISDQITRYSILLHYGSIDYWLPMMNLHFMKEFDKTLQPLVRELDQTYNTDLAASDYRQPCYRAFLILLKNKEDLDLLQAALADQKRAGSNDMVGLIGRIAEREKQTMTIVRSVRANERESRRRQDGLQAEIDQLAETSDRLARQNQDLLADNNQLAETSDRLARQNQDLLTENNELVEIADNVRLELRTQNDRVATLDREVTQLSGTVSNLQQRSADLKAQHDRDMNGMTQEVDNLHGVIAAKDASIVEIFGSTSWRLSSPIRRAGRLWRMIKFLPQSVRLGIQFEDGFYHLLITTIRVLRREGIEGIRLRARHLMASGRQAQRSITGSTEREYNEWIQANEDDASSAATAQSNIGQFDLQPLISIVMPVFEPPPEFLQLAIESVVNQSYPNWELCIADDASREPHVARCLRRFARRDNRIKFILREKNEHIAKASNTALTLATGQYVALMDQDDLLPPNALYWVVDTINRHPDVKLIYSDEDKIDIRGERSDPYFKTDWNPGLFLSQNMVCHLGVYAHNLVRQLGGFRQGYEGAQDYDLALRMSEEIAENEIVHIPRVLYHWRQHAQSTALNAASKEYAVTAGQRVIQDHLDRIGEKATVLIEGTNYRVKYALPDSGPLVSLIIPTKNHCELLRSCMDSIRTTEYDNYEIIVVDNSSDDVSTLTYLASLAEQPDTRVVRIDDAFNFAALNNLAVKLARGQIIGMINNDIEVISPAWLGEMVSHVLRKDVAVVGAKLVYPDDSIQHAGVILGIGGVAGHAHKHFPPDSRGYFSRLKLIQDFSAVTAACILVRKDVYESLGGLDEKNLAIAFNDVDFCLRVKAHGYRIVWTPYAKLYHHESISRGLEDSPEKRERFAREATFMKKKWGNILLSDPAYNPNLTLAHEDFRLAEASRVPKLAG
jgi:glycosyltransferase involved in cell wall biosynthesis